MVSCSNENVDVPPNNNDVDGDNNSNDNTNLKPEQPNIDSSNIPKGWWVKNNATAAQANQYPIGHIIGSSNNLSTNPSNKPIFFNYPHYDSTGKYATLKSDGEPVHNYPSPGVQSGPNQFSQDGFISTEKHVQLAKQVFSVGFHNGSEMIGTCWILDYKLTDDESYPLTWYFGTNAHVLDDLKVADDRLYPEKFGQYNPVSNTYRTLNTSSISLWRLINPKVGVVVDSGSSNNSEYWAETQISFCNNDKWGEHGIEEGYYLNKTPLKTIFTGNDFLTTSPKDDSTNSYSDREEYADFGVFELTFENEQQARIATNDYYNWPENKKFKYHRDDLLNNPSLRTNRVYELGYPQVQGGYTATRSVSINLNKQSYNSGIKDEPNGFSRSINYNTWINSEGTYDGHIAMPFFGYQYEWVDNSIEYLPNESSIKKTPYSTYGLIYAIDNGNMAPGSSGALVVDENGYALGIHFSSDNNAATGSAQAFYCKGYDYKGYYGNYNLPQYDLIRGGYPKQKGSYYDGLVKLYGKDSNFKTRLFPNGLISRE
ncbi:MIP family Ig-specific serine endopeptidase [Mycoplasmoides alvi]|uniref:MIP family Ig-specific serine endopeptidase n=1 Tax=Mycoplasmoides alvi TaxID=78580 RepID=UPI00051AE567|nr:DUF31 family protein [Mycoplasmoides alvi]